MSRKSKYTYEQLINYDKITRDKIIYEQRKNSLQKFDEEFLLTINPQNKNLLLDFMNFIAYSDMALRTCQGIKSNLTIFFKWNRDFNENKNFRLITVKQAEQYFTYIKCAGYTYMRAKVMKSDITSLADFCEFVLGQNEFKAKGVKNHWYTYKNHKWREVDIQQTEEVNGYKKTNVSSFSEERLDALKFYLKQKQDYMGMIILDFAYLGEKLLFLKEDDEVFNKQMKSVKSYFKWKEREGASDIPDVLIIRRDNGVYTPMSLPELRDYARMFSVFLGKEFIIC